MFLRADYAGCGKSYACEDMRKRGQNVLMVCPTNELVKEYKRRIGSNKFKQKQAEHPEYGIIDSTTVNMFSPSVCVSLQK